MSNLENLIRDAKKKIKNLETMKVKVKQPSRTDKLEELINNLGTTLCFFILEKVATRVGKEPMFVYVPKIPLPAKCQKRTLKSRIRVSDFCGGSVLKLREITLPRHF